MVAVRFTVPDRQTQMFERYHALVGTTNLFCFKAAPLTGSYD